MLSQVRRQLARQPRPARRRSTNPFIAGTRRRPLLEQLEDRTLLDGSYPPELDDPNATHLLSQIIVRFQPGVTESPVMQGTHLDEEIMEDMWTIRLDQGITVAQAVAAYSASPLVAYAEPDWIIRIGLTPDDPSFANGSLWGLHNTGQSGGTADADIDAPEGWNIRTTAPNIIVADIDTGVKWDHPDLAANIWTNADEIANNGLDDDNNGFIDDVRGWDFANDDNNPTDDNGHGTHTAGTIGAVGNNSTGVVGVAWGVQIMPMKFLTAGGSGSTSDAIQCVNYAHQNGATVTSNSWGSVGGFSQGLFDAIKAGRDNFDAIFVAAAGNNNINTDTTAHYPSAYNLDNIISVAATDRNDNRASFSNYGLVTVDLAAPGVSINSTWNNNGYNSISGTSMACPHVAGAVALVRAQFGSFDYLEVIQKVYAGVDLIPAMNGRSVTGGRLNLHKALLPISLPPFNVSAGGPYTLLEGNNLSLSGSAEDPENDPITYTWDINGDGNFSDATGQNPTLTWAQLNALSPTINDGPAVFNNVRVRANDGFGNIVASPATSLTVTNRPPTATLGNNGPAAEDSTTTSVSFSNLFDFSPADIAAGLRFSYDLNNDGAWDVGNGTTYAGSVTSATQIVPTSFFGDGPGNITAKARVFDKDGGFAELFTTINIVNAPPSATFTNNGPVDEGSALATVSFTGQTDASAADVLAGFRYSYDFDDDGIYEVGDGLTYAGSSTAATQNVSGSFLAEGPGLRRVRARIFDKDGGFRQLTTDIIVGNLAPTATLGNNGPFNEGASGAIVAFANQNDISVADVAAGFRYAYDFNNDGFFEVGSGAYAGSSASATANIPASFLADGPGFATIRARIIDKDDGFLDLTTNIVLNNIAPTTTPPASNVAGKEGTNSLFNLGSFTDPGLDNPWAVTVNWGDGQVSNFNANAVGTLGQLGHTYADNGTFQVQVTVNDGDGGVHASFFDVTVKNVKPQVVTAGTQFGTERVLGLFDIGGFTDLGVNDAPWNVQVNWGDGTAVDSFDVFAQGPLGQIPHQFARDGTFNVSVCVTDADGAKRVRSFAVVVANTDIVITGTDAGSPALVRVYDSSSNVLLRQFNPFPDLPGFNGGARVAAGDVTGDGRFDYIIGAGPGTSGQVRVFDGVSGALLDQFTPYAGGSPSLMQGVYVAVGDINFDGRKDIITGAGGLSQEVSVFSYGTGVYNPAQRTLFDRFNAFPGFGTIDGVTVASDDVNGDGRDDIVVGAGPGGPSRVAVFRYTNGQGSRTQIAGFQAFENGYRRGIFVAAADLSGDGRAEIIIGAGTTSGRVTQDGPNGGRGILPRVRIFSSVGGTFFHTEVQPYPTSVDTGVRVAALEEGGLGKLFLATGHSVPGQIKKFDGRTLQAIDTLFSDPNFTNGLWVGASR
jgi:subtilisin family serine protease